MHKWIVTLTLLLILVSCSQQHSEFRVAQQIHHIENSLVALKSSNDMFLPHTEQLADPKTLADRMKHYKVPGVSIAVINDNRIEWAKAYGVLDAETKAPATTETIFEAASTSKFVTAVLVLHFVEQGLVDLDANVNDYLTSWKVPENEFTQEEKVTLRRLLTHQAGLPTTDFDYDENIGYPTLLNVLNGESPAMNKPAIPVRVPGSRWEYSNVAYDVIQLLLEDITGKPFEQIAQETVFQPLGMTNSTFVYPLNSAKRRREAMPHDAEGNTRRPSMHRSALAHGGMTTTPTDLARFTNEILLSYQGRSEKIISQEMTRQLLTRQCDLDPKTVELFGMPISEGLGVFLIGEGKDFVFMHPGENRPGLISWLIGWPERGAGVVVMSNGIKGRLLSMEITSALNSEYDKTLD
ncbi:MAG: beta-lactamase family protein [Phycisphaerales bacterium]|nr:MAG: beta-lactamase family protein [Phycisphaerales bacterium]